MLARELMQPRANNKNCIKVSIDSHDDNEDIMNKMEQARLVQQNANFGKNRYEEEKMDIEEPVENKKPILLTLVGRKSESVASDMQRMNQPSDRKFPTVGRDCRPIKVGSEMISNCKGRDLAMEGDKQPLLSHNVTVMHIN